MKRVQTWGKGASAVSHTSTLWNIHQVARDQHPVRLPKTLSQDISRDVQIMKARIDSWLAELNHLPDDLGEQGLETTLWDRISNPGLDLNRASSVQLRYTEDTGQSTMHPWLDKSNVDNKKIISLFLAKNHGIRLLVKKMKTKTK